MDVFHLGPLELESGFIGNESGGNGDDGFLHFQIIFFQGRAGLHDVHDDVGQAQDGGDLDGAVQFDDVDLPAKGGVVFGGDVDELGGHPEGALTVVVEILGTGHCHAAFAQAQIQQFVNVGAVFQQDVLTGHADVGGTPFHVNGYVGGLHPEVADALFGIFKNQLSVVFLDGGAGDIIICTDKLTTDFVFSIDNSVVGDDNLIIFVTTSFCLNFSPCFDDFVCCNFLGFESFFGGDNEIRHSIFYYNPFVIYSCFNIDMMYAGLVKACLENF